MNKIKRFEFTLNRQQKAKITDEQIEVIKEVCSDAALFGEFLAKMCFYLRHTTNANSFKASFGIDDKAIYTEILKGTLTYTSKKAGD